MGMTMFPALSVGKVNGGLFGKQSAYADPFRASGKALNMNTGIFAKNSNVNSLSSGIFGRQSATKSLSGGIFGSNPILLFGAPTRQAPKRKKPAAKKTTRKPVIYGNSTAAKGGAVVVQKNGKTRKIPVKRLPPRRKGQRR